MNKLKKIGRDAGMLVLTGVSAGFYTLVEFCGMRGPHSKDFCDIYSEKLYGTLLILHLILGLVIVLDILFICFTENTTVLKSRSKCIIIVTQFLLAGVIFLLLTLG